MTDEFSIEQLLVDAGIIDHPRLEECLEIRKNSDRKLQAILAEKGFITEEKYNEILGLQAALSTGDLGRYGIREEVLNLMPEKFCRENSAIPVERIGKVIIVAATDRPDSNVLDEIQFRTGLKVKTSIISKEDLARAIDKHYRRKEQGKSVSEPDGEALEDLMSKSACVFEEKAVEDEDEGQAASCQIAEKSPVVELVNLILMKAMEMGASHIHVEPLEKSLCIRYRIDGSLHTMENLPSTLTVPVVSRIKLLANCDISEKRLPQDGTIELKIGRTIVHTRVGILPTAFGERIVMVILDKEMLRLDLGRSGFSLQDQEKLKRAVQQPSGLILVTGPKGAGKKSTLYALVFCRDVAETSILSAEKPISFMIPGISQVQVKEEIGLTYEVALRTFVQQDPDVIMIQEICDRTVAKMAVQMAMDCCLILSALRADEASASLRELIDLGVQPTLAGSAVRLVLSQRLIRKLCNNCKLEYGPSSSQLENIRIPDRNSERAPEKPESGVKLYKSAGCEKCHGTGYRGRLLVYELLEISEKIREAILKNASKEEIKNIALKEGMETLNQNAWRKVLDGATSLEEYLKISL